MYYTPLFFILQSLHYIAAKYVGFSVLNLYVLVTKSSFVEYYHVNRFSKKLWTTHLRPLEVEYMFTLTLSAPNPQNGQTHSNNSSANCRRIFLVCLTIL